MKRIVPLVVVAALIAFVGSTMAEEGKPAPKGKMVRGKITKVEESKVTVAVKKEGAESEVVLTVNDASKIKIPAPAGEGERKMADGKLADLQVGMFVMAKVGEENVVLEVMAYKEMPKRDGGDKKEHKN